MTENDTKFEKNLGVKTPKGENPEERNFIKNLFKIITVDKTFNNLSEITYLRQYYFSNNSERLSTVKHQWSVNIRQDTILIYVISIIIFWPRC